MKSEYKEKESEEASLIARVRRAIKNNDEDGERSYNSIISKVVEEKIEKQIEEYNIYIKNHSTSLNIYEGLILQALEDFNGLRNCR
ncbi:hypothetical protein [Oceanobacillus sp. 1P07AA]|uniref:hypothetical protein n=1 Tax=Oceanobacillus sp. 1P07AA TaxID=3132293 RepID=UPI0039A73B11